MPFRYRHVGLLFSWALLLFAACGHDGRQPLRMARLERVLVETPESELRDSLAQFAASNPTPLLSLYPDDPQFMQMVSGYRSDPTANAVYDTVMKYFPDLSWLENDLSAALAEARCLDTAINYRNVVTYISNAGYANRVAVDRESRSIAISIDEYVAQQMQSYGYFGEPLYIVRLCGPQHIVPDCMAEVIRQHIVLPQREMTLLDYMIAEGKVIYFLKKVLPSAHDTLLFRYSDEQMQWMRRNEGNVWAYFVQRQMLYEHDYNKLRNFVDDAPKTNAFQESAPRTTAYIGWRIVSLYAKNKKTSFRELMEYTDGQAILSASGYKP